MQKMSMSPHQCPTPCEKIGVSFHLLMLSLDPPPHPIGRQVICVNDQFETSAAWPFSGVPVKDGIYTIGALIWISDRSPEEAILAVRLAEFPPLPTAPPDCGFSLRHFRLLEDVKRSDAP